MTAAGRRRGRSSDLIARSLGVIAVGLGVVALAGCSGGATTPASPVATTTVDLPKSYRFAPSAIAVDVGATVTWTNNDNFTHNVSFPNEAALTMRPGEQATRPSRRRGRSRTDARSIRRTCRARWSSRAPDDPDLAWIDWPGVQPAIGPRSRNCPKPRRPTNAPLRMTSSPRTTTSRTTPVTSAPSYGV